MELPTMRTFFFAAALAVITSAEAHAQRCAAIAFSWNGAWASQSWTGDYACDNARTGAMNACRANGGRGCGYMTTAFDCMAVAHCNHWNGQRHAFGSFGATRAQAESNALGAVVSAGWSNCYIRVWWCPYGEFARGEGE
jgi:hypothetical protein